MTELEYRYTILKYRHDAVVGEVMNVGVVLFCRETGQVGFEFSPHYRRLSQAFPHFDGDGYRLTMGRFKSALESLGSFRTTRLVELEDRARFGDIHALLRAIWPDHGLSYFPGPVTNGVSADMDRETRELFQRVVLSQHPTRESAKRFDDQALWERFKTTLTSRGILEKLQSVSLGPAEVEFEHAYKNERWHVIEPVSLDYQDGNAMKKRAFQVAGKAASVRDLEDMGTLTVLLGKPRRAGESEPYRMARHVLDQVGGIVRIVEESDSEAFAESLEREMRDHGLIH